VEPRRGQHGDFSANLPLRIQGLARMKAIEVAEALRATCRRTRPSSASPSRRPGFLNFYLAPAWVAAQSTEIVARGRGFAALTSARASACRSST
jgi:arginyl-tRNA synthetase